MFDNTLSINLSGAARTFTRINQQSYSSLYVGEVYTNTDSEEVRPEFTIKHTVPAKAGDVESHMIRLDLKYFSSTGEYLRTESVWHVLRTQDGVQKSGPLGGSHQGLLGLTNGTFINRINARES